MAEDKVQLVKMPNDGNCMFHAVAFFFRKETQQVKNDIAGYLPQYIEMKSKDLNMDTQQYWEIFKADLPEIKENNYEIGLDNLISVLRGEQNCRMWGSFVLILVLLSFIPDLKDYLKNCPEILEKQNCRIGVVIYNTEKATCVCAISPRGVHLNSQPTYWMVLAFTGQHYDVLIPKVGGARFMTTDEAELYLQYGLECTDVYHDAITSYLGICHSVFPDGEAYDKTKITCLENFDSWAKAFLIPENLSKDCKHSYRLCYQKGKDKTTNKFFNLKSVKDWLLDQYGRFVEESTQNTHKDYKITFTWEVVGCDEDDHQKFREKNDNFQFLWDTNGEKWRCRVVVFMQKKAPKKAPQVAVASYVAGADNHHDILSKDLVTLLEEFKMKICDSDGKVMNDIIIPPEVFQQLQEYDFHVNNQTEFLQFLCAEQIENTILNFQAIFPEGLKVNNLFHRTTKSPEQILLSGHINDMSLSEITQKQEKKLQKLERNSKILMFLVAFLAIYVALFPR